MEKIQILASILLIERLVAVTFIGMVIRRQWNLFKYPINRQIRKFRRMLFALSISMLLGNFIPIAIHIGAIFAEVSKNSNPSNIGVMYALSNATTAIISALFVWTLYRMAAYEPHQDNETDHKR